MNAKKCSNNPKELRKIKDLSGYIQIRQSSHDYIKIRKAIFRAKKLLGVKRGIT